MLEIMFLDASIARLDLAVARASLTPEDPLAAFELGLCLERLANRLWFADAAPHVQVLLLRAVSLSRRLEVHRPDSVAAFRGVLLDIAAAISARPRDV